MEMERRRWSCRSPRRPMPRDAEELALHGQTYLLNRQPKEAAVKWLKAHMTNGRGESCIDGCGCGIFALADSPSTYTGVQGFPSISVKAKMLRKERRSWVPGRLHARNKGVEEAVSSCLAS